MNTAYLVPPLVLGMGVLYLWLIHHFWLRHAFKEDSKPMEPANAKLERKGNSVVNATQGFEGSTSARPVKVLYTAKAHTTGGREGGASRTSDGRLNAEINLV